MKSPKFPGLSVNVCAMNGLAETKYYFNSISINSGLSITNEQQKDNYVLK